MKKLLLLLILSFLSTQGLTGKFNNQWVSPQYPSNTSGAWICYGECGDLPAGAKQNSVRPRTGGTKYGSSYNEATLITAPKRVPRISQGFCNKDSDSNYSNIERISTNEYWSTYLGGIVNKNSLKEFFSIIDNQYSSGCDGWFREYFLLGFHKAIVFGYERNISNTTGYWAISLSDWKRGEAEDFAIQACEDAHRINKIKSFTCAILFSNNNIVNKEYLALAKLNKDEYEMTISDYKDEIQKAQLSESDLIESADYIEKIKEVKTLLDMGIITYGEFEQMKQKIIDTMN